MSVHLERARLLLAQSRPADAEREVMLALAHEPGDAQALALLALSRVEQENHQEALAAAREAVGLAPDQAYFHYVYALVLHRQERDEEALAAVRQAVELDPADADCFALIASIELARRKWADALAAAEQALALFPEHVSAANLRAMALVRLGRKGEAMQTIDHALARDPENAFSHANQGWNCLHRNQPRPALEHFREALRLDPDLDYAREGMLAALKARNPVYRVMLAYFLWMGRLSGQVQWSLIIGIWFGSRLIRGLAAAQPTLAWFWWTVLGLLYAFVYLTWTAQPMFNLLLRLDRFGRHVLSSDQRVGSNWFGAMVLGGLAGLVWWLFQPAPVALGVMLGFAGLSVCVAATFNQNGKPRRKLAFGTALFAAVGIAALVAAVTGRHELAASLATILGMGFLGFQLFANVVSR